MKAELEDGGTVEFENGVFSVLHAGKDAVYADMRDVIGASFTRAGVPGYFGAFVLRLHDGTDVVVKVQEADGLKLNSAFREARENPDNHFGRFEDDGGVNVED